jgi:hypothetical protein
MRTVEELIDAARSVIPDLLPAWLESLLPEERRVLEIRHQVYKEIRKA